MIKLESARTGRAAHDPGVCSRALAGSGVLLGLVLAGCSEGRQPTTLPHASEPTYSIGGTVSGLAGDGLILRLSTGESLPVTANGAISFASRLANGAPYSVTIQQLPSNPGQLCITTRGAAGVAMADINDVTISCSDADPALKGRILFSTMGDPGPDIVMLDFDRLAMTRLTSGPARDYMPEWSPDGRRIAFARSDPLGTSSSSSGVWLMDADGSHASQLVSGSPGYGGVSFTWSPDGSRLAVCDGTSFRVVKIDGSGLIPVAPLTYSYTCSRPAWSPDGSTIAFVGDSPDSGLDWFFQVIVMNADGSNVRRLTSGATYDGNIDPAERKPSWSPDGTKLTFWSAAYGLTVVDRNGTLAHSASNDSYRAYSGPGSNFGLSVSPEAAPVWSPDGTHLVFQKEGQLFVTRADGSGTPRQITAIVGGAHDPSWAR